MRAFYTKTTFTNGEFIFEGVVFSQISGEIQTKFISNMYYMLPIASPLISQFYQVIINRAQNIGKFFKFQIL